MSSKFWYAILVVREMRFVTAVNNLDKFAEWKEGEKAVAFGSKKTAESIAEALTMNGFTALVVPVPTERLEEVRNLI